MPQRDASVLITGGAGFIGGTLVRQWLAEEAAQVVNLDKLTYAGLRISLEELAEDPRHLLVEGDICDAALVRELLAEHRPRAVLHLAAETHVDRSIDEPPKFAETNVIGTCTLLDQATRHWMGLSGDEREQFRFLFMSTDEVFGSAAPGEHFTDRSPLAANSPYAASKAAGEHLVHAFAHTYGLPTVAINPTNNYGPRQMPEKFIPRMILAAISNQPLPLYGDGLQERDWLHVDDCCRAIRTVLRRGSPGRRYLAGSGREHSNRAVAEMICDMASRYIGDGVDRRALIAHVADRPGHDRRYAVDAGPLAALGWSPQTSLADGLAKTVAWYVDNSAWTATAVDSLRRRDLARSPT
ncbi:MAG TPA: dTDP-glucose 4,6-dehydratase [Lacipirellula sp.]